MNFTNFLRELFNSTLKETDDNLDISKHSIKLKENFIRKKAY